MPPGERQRRRDAEAAALAKLEAATGPADPQPSQDREGRDVDDGTRRAVVIEVSTSLCRVDLDGRVLLCPLRGVVTAAAGFTNAIAVGDEVLVTPRGEDAGIVEAVLPRRSALARPDVHHTHLQQVIVANADQLLIVAAWRDPAIWLELVDRYLITAQRFHLAPIICVNKTDLAADGEVCRATHAALRGPGLPGDLHQRRHAAKAWRRCARPWPATPPCWPASPAWASPAC